MGDELKKLLKEGSRHIDSSLKNTPMGDELKKLLKEGSRHIDSSLENTPTSHVFSLCMHVVILKCL